MAFFPYHAFGFNAQSNIVDSISKGPIRTTVEIMLLLHLISAFPIILNPPSQFFEYMLHVPIGEDFSANQFLSVRVK